MISRLLITISIFFLISSAYSQPDSLWSRTYGGVNIDVCTSAQQTTDGGYILAGYTQSGDTDFWIVKTDINGDSVWSRTYGGNGDERCYCVQQTSDTCYVLTGFTDSYDGEIGYGDFWLVKTNRNGDVLWSQTYGEGYSDYCQTVTETFDGGFALAGYTMTYDSDWEFWLVKTNSNGDCLWSHTFGSDGPDQCYSMQQTSDSGFVLAGYTGTIDWPDVRLIRTDASGDVLWNRTFGGGIDRCRSVKQTIDGGFILTGDRWILKTDANGDSLWSYIYDGWRYFNCVWETIDGGYVLGGTTSSSGVGGEDFELIKTSAMGDNLWSRTFGGSESDGCSMIQQTTDGGFILVGSTWSYGNGNSDFWLVKTGPDPLGVIDGFAPMPTSISLSAFPNPFNSELTLDVSGFSREVRVSLLNVLGQEVELIHEGVLAGNRIHYAAPATMSSGLYFVKAEDARNVRTEKVVFLK
ncbi:T9SS type A sorting domain-containing protein [bacterium]|nr:T9SS type A sorting domain-containing protein [bacterium]